jgi:hypothetical protein
MNADVKTLQDFDMRQKLAHLGIQATGHIATAGVVVFLVLAWAITSPLVRLGDQLAGSRKVKTNK